MVDKKLTEKESLEVITSMIARTKARYLGGGDMLLMWGYLVVTVSLLVWIMLATTGQAAWSWLWFAIPVIGCPAMAIMVRRKKQEYGAVTYSDRVTSRLWSIFGICVLFLILLCLGFQFIGDRNCWSAVLTFSVLVAPCAEIAQGLLIKEKCLIWGGFIGMAIGIITLCCVAGEIPLSINWYMPLYIFAWVAMMIVPGHFLNNKARKE